MNPVKQALIKIKEDWKNTAILGVTASAYIFMVRHSPLLGAFLISLGILFFQEISEYLLIKKQWPRSWPFKGKKIFSYLIISIILIPSVILSGSALGIIESPQSPFMTVPLTLFLLVLSLYFYFILSHSLRFHYESQQSIGKSIDLIGLSSLKKILIYVNISFLAALGILLAVITKGVALVVALPFIFFLNHYCYEILRNTFFSAIVQKQSGPQQKPAGEG